MNREFAFGNPNVRESIDALFGKAPFILDLGIELVDMGPGWCETSLQIEDKHHQQDTYIHAGVLATMADHTAGAAAGSLVGEGQIVLTVEFKINFLRPAVGESLRCRAEVLRGGKSIIVVESEVYASRQGAEKMVSKSTVTIAVV